MALLQPGQSAFGANANPTPFIISGLKAAQPGGLGNTQTNTLPAKQTASPSNQVATGNNSNASSIASGISINPATGTSVNLPGLNFGTGMNSTNTSTPSNGTIASLLTNSLVQPSTPVKSVSTDGQGGQTVTYHAPDTASSTSFTTGATNNGQPVSGAPGGPINGGAITQNNATPNSQNGTFTTPSGAVVDSNGNTISTPNNTSSLQGTTGALIANAGQNQTLAQNAQNIGNYYQNLSKETTQESQGLENAYGTTPGMAFPTSQGLAQNAASTAGNLLTGYANSEQQALAANAQGLTGNQQAGQQLGAAAQLQTPSNTTQQVSPGSTVLNSQNQQVFSGLGSLSQYQAEQISNAQRGQYGAQAQSISTGLTAMGNTYQNVQAIAQANGINPTQYPSANSLIQAMQAQITNPGGVAAFNEAVNALKTQMAQQIQNFASSGALTPTASSGFVAQLNSSTLTPTQLGQLYDAVTATGLANLNAVTAAESNANTATNSATLPSSFSSSQPSASTYTPPANIQGSQTLTGNDGNQYNFEFVNGQWVAK